MNDILALRPFVRIARLGSFSRAARELCIGQPSTSKLIKALERGIGVALLLRTTRAVVLTEAGATYHVCLEPVLDALDDAGQAVRGRAAARDR